MQHSFLRLGSTHTLLVHVCMYANILLVTLTAIMEQHEHVNTWSCIGCSDVSCQLALHVNLLHGRKTTTIL